MAKYRFHIKSPDTARALFDDWNETLGNKVDEADFLDCGEYFTVELDTATHGFEIVPLRPIRMPRRANR
jgi:hypothetical protein